MYPKRSKKLVYLAGAAASCLVLALAAQAQSPFAKKDGKKQAWETEDAVVPTAPGPQSSSYVPPTRTRLAPPTVAKPVAPKPARRVAKAKPNPVTPTTSSSNSTSYSSSASSVPTYSSAGSSVPTYSGSTTPSSTPTYSGSSYASGSSYSSSAGSSVPPTGSSVPTYTGSTTSSSYASSRTPRTYGGGGSSTPPITGSTYTPSTSSYAAAKPYRAPTPYAAPSTSEIVGPDIVQSEFAVEAEELWPGKPSVPSRWTLGAKRAAAQQKAQEQATQYAQGGSSGGSSSPFAPQGGGQGTYTPPWMQAEGQGSPVPPTSANAFEATPKRAPQDSYVYNPNDPTYQSRPGGGYYNYEAPFDKMAQNGSSVPPTGYGSPVPSDRNYPGASRQPQSWKDKVGLSNLLTTVKGFLKIGGAATERDGDWDADFIADGMVEGEVSAMTMSGLEYGLGGRLRGQYDKYRDGFGGRIGDCPAGILGCPTAYVGGVATPIRGYTSQFYTDGVERGDDTQFAVEGAYLFLRSAYGDVTVGRDNGAAYLFSLGAPSLLAVGASNSPVDYTGLDAVRTLNNASGFSEKITYTSPRLLGDTVGVGIQVGASYAMNGRACGVDYCVEENGKDGTNVLTPDMENIVELGLALDRNFGNGLNVEGTVTYAMGSEQSTLPVFENLKSLGLGLEVGFNDFTVGGSYLKSNNGLVDGDYKAWDIGATWKPSKLGFTVGYGHAKDEIVGMTSDQATVGITYDIRERFQVGTGVQYINRDVNVNNGGVISGRNENGTGVFLEGRFTF